MRVTGDVCTRVECNGEGARVGVGVAVVWPKTLFYCVGECVNLHSLLLMHALTYLCTGVREWVRVGGADGAVRWLNVRFLEWCAGVGLGGRWLNRERPGCDFGALIC